jgi:hypothetical protein
MDECLDPFDGRRNFHRVKLSGHRVLKARPKLAVSPADPLITDPSKRARSEEQFVAAVGTDQARVNRVIYK